MNIVDYLPYAEKTVSVKYTVHNSYIEISNNLVFTGENDVHIDVPIDTHKNVTFSYGFKGKVTLNAIINVAKTVSADYNDIIPGSFIGDNLYYTYKLAIYSLYINGYVMHHGVLS